jgi:squalene-hopene/tetraprenyl-beta-curcumene cyclase
VAFSRSADDRMRLCRIGRVGTSNKRIKGKMTPRNDLLSSDKIDLEQILTRLDGAIERGQKALLEHQSQGGYWVDTVEADSTITSESLLFRMFLGLRDPEKERKKVRYLLSTQLSDGGWHIYPGGESNVSASVKAYFALKLCGVSPDSPEMVRARERILVSGGLSQVNVFTKITLALFGQYDWEGIPTLPPEIIFFPPNFYFSLYQVSYWSRTVIVPLLVIFAKKPLCSLPGGMGLSELRLPEVESTLLEKDPGWFTWRNFFITVDRVLKFYERHRIDWIRRAAVERAHRWMVEHMRGSGGLGAIYPAMANSVIALRCLGYPVDHPLVEKAVSEIDELEVDHGDSIFVQPCHSVIWDTALSLNALIDSGVEKTNPSIVRGVEWLISKQTRSEGDWKIKAPAARPGGWYFQFENEFYPDNDDTAAVLLALIKALGTEGRRDSSTELGLDWLLKMQGKDGGWGAFDVDNNKLFLNQIPFADHGALLDPSTADVTGRVLEVLGLLGYDAAFPPAARALTFLRKSQESFGPWYGRWGVNYIYGIWSVLAGIRAIGEEMTQPYILQATAWLKSVQNPDGGWGESCRSYQDRSAAGKGPSTSSQTAWAVMSLLHAGEVNSPSLERGVRYLLDHQTSDGFWSEDLFTGTGFPRVFYLRYHMYCKHFPLWALSMYRMLRSKGQIRNDEIRLIYRTHRRSLSNGTSLP